MIYQTEVTRKVLEKIEEASRVKWNAGELPTEYWCELLEDRGVYLSVSTEPFLAEYTTVSPMSLFAGERDDDRTMCTADEFVAYCNRMLPRD
jgi:hypothetical protein